jgi:hypothetical protein
MRILQDCMEYVSHSTNVILDSQFITEIHTCMFENKPDVTYEKDDKYNQYFGKKNAFFWVITQPLVVICYRRFGPLFKGQESRKILVDDPEHFEISRCRQRYNTEGIFTT